MCEKNDFLKALMPCRGRKIIIHPAGSFTKYWNHISNFSFGLVLLGIYKHMFHFQVLFLFFPYVVIFKNVEQKTKVELMLFPLCFFLVQLKHIFCGVKKIESFWKQAIADSVCVCARTRTLNIFNFFVQVTYVLQSLPSVHN